MDIGKFALVLLLGVLICIVDAQRYKLLDDLKLTDAQRNKLLDDLKLPDLKLDDKKEKNLNLNLNPMVNNGRLGLQSNLDYKKDNWKFGVEHQFQDVPKPFKDYHRIGGSVGYDNGRFSVTGHGHYDNTGNWGAGVKLGWRFKRSLPNYRPKGAFYLRVEADPCQFILYDRNSDGVISDEELREVFPDRNLADGLFQRLDIEDRGEITLKEFEAAKASGAIVGCAGPVYKQRIPDESDLE